MPKRTAAISIVGLTLLAVSLFAARVRHTSHYRVRFGDRAARIKAVHELAHKPRRQALGSLTVALGDEDPDVRALTVRVLTELRAVVAVASFQRLARTDADSEVRAMAAASLGELPAADSFPVLLAALADPSANVRTSAASALGKLKAKAAADGLVACLDDDSEALREAAIASLGKLRSETAVPKLAELLDEEEEVPISRIQEALIAIVGKNLGIDPEPWQVWYRQRKSGNEG